MKPKSNIQFIIRIIILSLVIILLIAIFYIYSHRDSYINTTLKALQSGTGYSITFEQTEFSLIPVPSLILRNVRVDRSIAGQPENFLLMKSARFNFSWLHLLTGSILIDDIHMSNGVMTFLSLPAPADTGTSDTPFPDTRPFDKLHSVIFENVTIDWIVLKNNARAVRTFRITEARIERDKESDFNIILHSFHNNGRLDIKGAINNLNLRRPVPQDVQMDLEIGIQDFPFYRFITYFTQVPLTNLNLSLLDGTFTLSKMKSSNVVSIRCKTRATNLITAANVRIQAITFSTNMYYNYVDKKIVIDTFTLQSPKTVYAGGTGTLSFPGNMKLYLYAKISYANSRQLSESLSLFAGLRDTGGSYTIRTAITFNAEKVIINGIPFTNLTGNIASNNNQLNMVLTSGTLSGGSLSGSGIFNLTGEQADNMSITYNGALVENFLSNFTAEKYIVGMMQASMSFTSSGMDTNEFLKNLRARGSIAVFNGQLHGYANVLKPLLRLGKLVNLLGPRGKISGFQKLSTDIQIANEKIYINNLKMKGVGLDASGDGWIGFDHKINMQIMVGLGGITGALIRVPVLYRGRIPQNYAFVDPLWLGSAYAGMLIIPGPLGAAGGATVFNLFDDIAKKIKRKNNKQ